MPAEKISQSLYGGEVAIDFYPASHRYKKDGEFLISATAITGVIDKSGVLIPWALRLVREYMDRFFLDKTKIAYSEDEIKSELEQALIQHQVKKDAACDIGTMVHKFADDFTKAKKEKTALPDVSEMPEGAINGINAFLDWYNGNDIHIIHAEKLLYSKKHNYVGITDAIAEVNGENLIIDYKTSKAIYPEHKYQISGYWYAYEEENGNHIDGALLLHFDKETGELGQVKMDREELKKAHEVFLACRTVKRDQKEQNKK